MTWQGAMQRQAVAEWRDRHILQALSVFNDTACEAQVAFGHMLGEASVIDSVWDPAGFADARIDGLIGERIRPAISDLLETAAAELTGLNEEFSALSAALASPTAITFPEARPAPATPLQPEAAPTPATASDEGWLPWARRMATDGVSSATTYAAQTADWLIQDKAGFRDRLRVASGERLAKCWLGLQGEPRPVLAQVIAMIDDTSHEARTSLI